MALSSIVLAVLLSGAGQPAASATDGMEAVRVALGRVCLPGIVEASPIAPLALAAGMVSVPPTAVGAGPLDKAWGLGGAAPALAVAWADGSCTAMLPKGDKDAARATAEKVILARPEGFKRGSTMLADGDRVQRTVYCAAVRNSWAVISLTLPGPATTARTMSFSSTTYLRPTRSPLCDAT
jgi:hypothetical protein